MEHEPTMKMHDHDKIMERFGKIQKEIKQKEKLFAKQKGEGQKTGKKNTDSQGYKDFEKKLLNKLDEFDVNGGFKTFRV